MVPYSAPNRPLWPLRASLVASCRPSLRSLGSVQISPFLWSASGLSSSPLCLRPRSPRSRPSLVVCLSTPSRSAALVPASEPSPPVAVSLWSSPCPGLCPGLPVVVHVSVYSVQICCPGPCLWSPSPPVAVSLWSSPCPGLCPGLPVVVHVSGVGLSPWRFLGVPDTPRHSLIYPPIGPVLPCKWICIPLCLFTLVLYLIPTTARRLP